MSALELIALVPTFVLAFFRIAGMMLFAPLFGSSRIPRRVKLMLALVLAMSVTPGIDGPTDFPPSTWGLTAGIAGEMLFGFAMGMIQSFVFIAAQWAGEMIGQQMGFNLSEVFDPQFGAQGSLVGDMYFMLTLVVFLSVGGHHAMLHGVRDSFVHLPLLSLHVHASLFETLIGFFQGATILAVRLAAPMLVTMLVVDLSLGLVGKILPQMNIMAVGLSLRSALGLVIVILGLGLTNSVIEDGLLEAMDDVRAAWVAG
jgi:flagellar biosynthetic protein FliR